MNKVDSGFFNCIWVKFYANLPILYKYGSWCKFIPVTGQPLPLISMVNIYIIYLYFGNNFNVSTTVYKDSEMSSYKVIISGGGMWGHIYPL